MLISKKLQIIEDLDRISTSEIQEQMDVQKNILEELMNTHSEIDDSLLCNLNEITNVIYRINQKIAVAKEKLKNDINTMSPTYAANSYRTYETQLKYANADAYLYWRKDKPYPNTKKIIEGRIGTYIDWRYPGLEIGPGDSVWTRSLVGCDPLYIVDVHNEFLKLTKHSFNKQYRSRLRTYKTDHHDLSMLPQNQIGFVFSWNTFNFFPIETIKDYLKEIMKVLRPGGVFMFNYNNCEKPKQAELAESDFMSYTPKTILIDLVLMLGFEFIQARDEDSVISWLEIKKPGKLTSARKSPTVIEIKKIT